MWFFSGTPSYWFHLSPTPRTPISVFCLDSSSLHYGPEFASMWILRAIIRLTLFSSFVSEIRVTTQNVAFENIYDFAFEWIWWHTFFFKYCSEKGKKYFIQKFLILYNKIFSLSSILPNNINPSKVMVFEDDRIMAFIPN